MTSCPFGKDNNNNDDINLYLEGRHPFYGEWQSINNEIKFKSTCKKCPNYNSCEEWK